MSQYFHEYQHRGWTIIKKHYLFPSCYWKAVRAYYRNLKDFLLNIVVNRILLKRKRWKYSHKKRYNLNFLKK